MRNLTLIFEPACFSVAVFLSGAKCWKSESKSSDHRPISSSNLVIIDQLKSEN